ncbi:MAG: glycine cleavage system protein T, partial [Alphaproteobacteria bacterium]|nr:glycine cleavage system protein T [Alphaproteobacteria bacterium]
GIKRKLVGLVIDGENMTGPNTRFWDVFSQDKKVGKVTSAVYSPRLKKNIALAMIDISCTETGTNLSVDKGHEVVEARVTEIPFHDPKKTLATS